MFSLIIFALLGWCACASSSLATYYSLDQSEQYFDVFMQQYNKTYDSEFEKQTRFEIFKNNLMEINQLNNKSKDAVFGVTKFSDLTNTEFLSSYTGAKVRTTYDEMCPLANVANLMKVQSPDSYDWRAHGAVTRVKNQMDCGSCWAFSTTGNIESQYAIKHKVLQEVSEQQIIDCENEYSYKCVGGFISAAMLMLIEKGGSEPEQDYPYTARNGTCQFDASRVKVKVTGCFSYNISSEDTLKDIVYQTGPVSIALQANYLKHYHGGIIDASICNVGKIDHAVLIVGYGNESGTPYWIVKNSWGSNWGEQGYYRIERGTNACNLMNPEMATSVVA